MTQETREDDGWAWVITWTTSGIVARAEVRVAGIYGDGSVEADDEQPPDLIADVRSDGCMEIEMAPRLHFCTTKEVEAFGRMLAWLYSRGVELAVKSDEESTR